MVVYCIWQIECFIIDSSEFGPTMACTTLLTDMSVSKEGVCDPWLAKLDRVSLSKEIISLNGP